MDCLITVWVILLFALLLFAVLWFDCSLWCISLDLRNSLICDTAHIEVAMALKEELSH